MENTKEIELEDAIRISKILSTAPEERLSMILSTLEAAGVMIDGLEALAEWRCLSHPSRLIDLHSFVKDILTHFDDGKNPDFIAIQVKAFDAYCRERNLMPLLVKKTLYEYGILEPSFDGPKFLYSKVVRVNGATMRCVVLKKNVKMKGDGSNDD